MKRPVIFALLFSIAAVAFANPSAAEHQWDLTIEEMLPYNEEIDRFLVQRNDQSMGELTIGELRELTMRLSVIAQEENYVRQARQSSQVLPGSGHFMIGEHGVGAAYVTGSIVVAAATIVGAYFVLPDGVQFHELDYINDSFGTIQRAWRSESIASLLPAVGVLIAGGGIHGIIGSIAAEDAERKARTQIESGDKRFTPEPFIYPDATGRLILGARIGL